VLAKSHGVTANYEQIKRLSKIRERLNAQTKPLDVQLVGVGSVCVRMLKSRKMQQANKGRWMGRRDAARMQVCGEGCGGEYTGAKRLKM
jgi:hypothetical protein